MADIATALTDLMTADGPLDTAIARHFTSDYVQRTNGVVDDRDGFAAHIAHLRSITDHLEVTVLDEVADGERYCSRHRVHVAKVDGTSTVQEVYLFASRAADGRFRRVDEATVMLDGADADRNLGGAKG